MIERLRDKLSLEKRMTSAMGEEIAYRVGEEILLKARVAELEKEDTLWAMLDAIEKALFRRAAPHAWESVVTTAGMEFITSRRKAEVPANGE